MTFSRKIQRRYFWPVFVLAVGLALAAALAMQAQRWVDEQLTVQLDSDARQLAARMQQQFALQEEALRGLVGLFAASDEVSRREFRAHVDLLQLRERFPAALEFRFARRVKQVELLAWQRRTARSLAELGEAVPDLSPKPPGIRDEYRLVEYVAPFSPASLGLDVLESPRRAAIERLRAGQSFALSERLIDEYPDFPAYVLMAALPPKGEDPLPGTVALVFRADRLIDALAHENGLAHDVELYDVPPAAAAGAAVLPVYHSHVDKAPPRAGQAGSLQRRLPLATGDRQWTLVVTALPDWTLARQYGWFPWVVGAGGVLASLVATVLVGYLACRRQEAEQRLTLNAADLDRAQDVAEVGSWRLDGSGRLIWSRQTYRMFGIPVGVPLDYERFLSCVHSEDRDAVDRAWQAALKGAPYRIRHRIVVGGEVRWVEERAELAFAPDGSLAEADGTVRDITREKAAEDALRELNATLDRRVQERTARLAAVLDNLLDVVIVADDRGIIQLANPALARVLGYAPEEVLGQNVSLLMPEPHRSDHDGYIARYLATGEARIIGIGRQVEALSKSGERILVDLAVSEYRFGEKRYFVGVMHDVREYMRLMAEKERLLAERQEFLATMSHEIRTPLTGLLGMLELLSLTTLSDEQRHELAIARDSGKALMRIVDDILDYSKIEAGKLALKNEPENLKALIESVRDAYLASASAKRISLISFVDPRLPAAVVIDGARLRQILANFVSNALKFTAEGYVEVRADWLAGDAESVTLKLAVRDTGIGIATDAQAKLFERYSQADATVAHRHGGTGLGLAICKRLAEMMGGTIGVESQPAKGSTFFVVLTLPVAEVAVAPAPATPPTLRQLDAGGRAVLVADDHPINRLLIARQMQTLGLPVELAENGDQALSKWKDGDYAVILTDVHMPVMDGLELARAIRAIEAREGRKHTPIIAWTAAAIGEELARARAAGMDDVLVKPTELAQLRQVLVRWLPPFAATDEPVEGQANGAVLDEDVLWQLADDVYDERLILADYVHQTRRDLEALAAALQAGEGARAAREAHRIKGAARTTGANRLAARAERAEEAARRLDLAEAHARLVEMEADLAEFAARCGVRQEPAPSVPADGPPVWDESVLARMVGDAPALQRELIESFFTHSVKTLSEVRLAFDKREARALARAAHKLKSAARAIGALELGELAARLEAAGNNADWAATAAAYWALDAAWARLELHARGGTGQ